MTSRGYAGIRASQGPRGELGLAHPVVRASGQGTASCCVALGLLALQLEGERLEPVGSRAPSQGTLAVTRSW
jgi:hypothetical protein